MDNSSLYRTPVKEKSRLLKLQMAAYSVGNNTINKNRAKEVEELPMKKQLELNKKLHKGTMKGDNPDVDNITPVSRYFNSFKL